MEAIALNAAQDGAIRAAVARRVPDRTDAAGGSLRLEGARTAGIADVTLFRAGYGQGEITGVLAGTIDDEGEVNTYPNDALVGVWSRWLDAGGLPDAEEVLAVTQFLIGGEERVDVEPRSARLLDPADGVGVGFTWRRHIGRFRATYRLGDGIIELAEQPA